jgi:hypothetical protein
MLAVARVPAARVLLRIIEDFEADRCETCGRPLGDAGPVIRAATAVLDRAGLHPSMTVHVSRGIQETGFEGLSSRELVEELEKLIVQVKQADAWEHSQRALRAVPSVIDGEQVDAPLADDEGEL